MPAVAIVMIVVFVITVIIGGVVVGSQLNPRPSDSSNSSGADCDAACRQLDARQSERCAATAQTAFILSAVRTTERQLAGAVIAHLALVAAAVAASYIPIVGVVLAVVIGTAAASALTAVLALTGQLAAQNSALGNARRIEADAMSKVQEARDIVTKACPPEKAAVCLNKPAPC